LSAPAGEARYALGFSCTRDQVVLIGKARPAWQAGRLNGVGGKVEAGESSLEAMVREYREETGVDTEEHTWMPFGRISGADFAVDLFVRRTEVPDPVETCTDEQVYAVSFESLSDLNLGGRLVDNVPWLLAYLREPGVENRFLFLTQFPDSSF
jgi:8-oxo-dGTP diphosphatase